MKHKERKLIKWIITKNFCSLKVTVKRMKRKYTNHKKILAIHITEKRNISRNI